MNNSIIFNGVVNADDDKVYIDVSYVKVKRFLFWKIVKEYKEIFVVEKENAKAFAETLAKATKGIMSVRDELKFLVNN